MHCAFDRGDGQKKLIAHIVEHHAADLGLRNSRATENVLQSSIGQAIINLNE
jgi:hypothetical protein